MSPEPSHPDALNNLSDERTEYQINDRLSFMRSRSLELSDGMPDVKMVWLFPERLTQTGAIERLFDRFDATLRNAPLSADVRPNPERYTDSGGKAAQYQR